MRKIIAILLAFCMIAVLGGCGKDPAPADSQSKAESVDPNAERYSAAVALYESGDFEAALAEFEALADYKDAQSKAAEIREKGLPYLAAKKLMEEGKYPEAAWAFAAVGTYRDSYDLQTQCEAAWRENVAITSCNVTVNWEGESPIDYNWYIQDGIVKAKSGSYYKVDGAINREDKKAVSVGAYEAVLYDDGMAYGMGNYQHNGRIIKLSGGLCGAYVTLQSDGKMDVYYSADWRDAPDYGISKDWFEKIYSWEGVVDFKVEFDYLEATFANFDLKITAYFADGTKKTARGGNMY